MGIEAAIVAAQGSDGQTIADRRAHGDRLRQPEAGTNKVHGEAMGPADVAATKKFFGFPEDQSFYVPDDALANWREAVKRGAGVGSGVEQVVCRVQGRIS